ncbi:MAG: hypothetical protein AAFZ49_00230, partial [Cyanobacteria bacterium J06659_2]
MPQFRRRPGTQVNYTPLASYYYFSTQARRIRGLFKPPSASSGGDADGWQFRFNSNRAPKTYWTVTADKAEGDPPGEPGGSGPIYTAPGSGELYMRFVGHWVRVPGSPTYVPGFPSGRDHNYQGINYYAVKAERLPDDRTEGDISPPKGSVYEGWRKQQMSIGTSI